MKKNGGNNDIPFKFLKMCCSDIALHISNLFNSCIDFGIFPNILKTTKITPVFKKGSCLQISNYRPIGIICNISKIFEGLLNSRLKNYFHGNGILSSNQFGLRQGKNTELATLNFVDRMLPALKIKYYGISIFLDFSACFDTVTREILIEKINKYGINGTPLEFLKSYFSNRNQYVSYKGFDSIKASQNIGVIQGSKNGPLFYDIYSNDLCNIIDENNYLFFADDTCLTFCHENFDTLVVLINKKLSDISDWCKFNKLHVNPTKSEYMIVTNRKIPYSP